MCSRFWALLNSGAFADLVVDDVGQSSLAEIDAQAGAFSGLRLKALLFSGATYNLGLEGMYGGSLYASSAVFPATYGGGFRSEFYLSSGRQHAWMISPGLDGYYVPANRINQSEPKTIGDAVGNAVESGLFEVPTRVFTVSPNVDINWIYGRERFAIVTGVKIGVAVALNGTSSAKEDLRGKIYPDLGLYIGTRF